MEHAEIEKLVHSDIILSLDLTMFDEIDIANIVLQRSSVLYDVPFAGRIIRSWVRKDPKPLQRVVQEKGHDIVRRALAFAYLEFEKLQPKLVEFDVRSLADIGCGYAFIDLFLWRSFDCNLTLIDIESSETRGFGFASEGAGYSNLAKAQDFLLKNGVPEEKIVLINPKQDNLLGPPDIDVAISLLSCGFHYPLSTYGSYFSEKLKPGGGVIVDIRERDSGLQADDIAHIGAVLQKYSHMEGVNRTVIKRIL